MYGAVHPPGTETGTHRQGSRKPYPRRAKRAKQGNHCPPRQQHTAAELGVDSDGRHGQSCQRPTSDQNKSMSRRCNSPVSRPPEDAMSRQALLRAERELHISPPNNRMGHRLISPVVKRRHTRTCMMPTVENEPHTPIAR